MSNRLLPFESVWGILSLIEKPSFNIILDGCSQQLWHLKAKGSWGTHVHCVEIRTPGRATKAEQNLLKHQFCPKLFHGHPMSFVDKPMVCDCIFQHHALWPFYKSFNSNVILQYTHWFLEGACADFI